MAKADLHIHTKYSSDGEFEVSDIISKSQAQHIETISLTDHNSVKGIDEAIILSEKAGINFIPGIEIDCNYEGINLHLLGYRMNWQSTDFSRLEEDVYSKTMDSFAEMIHNINRLGFVIDADAVLAQANGNLPTGELIAEVMLSNQKYYSPLLIPYMQGGERSDMPYINFYLDYFAQGKPAFVPVNFISYKDAIEMVKENGGIPIVAHPGLNLKNRESIADALLEHGAEGLEVFNNYHNMEQIGYFASLVQKKNAIMNCGSDFHGKTKPLINIGQSKFDNQFESYLKHSIQQLKMN